MNDWQIVTKAEPWLANSPDTAVTVPASRPFNPTKQFDATFPSLTKLLLSARKWDVALAEGTQVLFAWGDKESGVRAWLSPAIPATVSSNAAPDHQVLLACFGGISQRFNEPEHNWLLNHNQALIAAEVERGASFLGDYAWAFDECGGIPIDVEEYYPAAWEANGNCVLCSRGNGELLFFAPDHCDENLVPYSQCPMYTLHTHREAATFQTWVERIADQWLREVV
jgi:hypothetical protein